MYVYKRYDLFVNPATTFPKKISKFIGNQLSLYRGFRVFKRISHG